MTYETLDDAAPRRIVTSAFYKRRLNLSIIELFGNLSFRITSAEKQSNVLEGAVLLIVGIPPHFTLKQAGYFSGTVYVDFFGGGDRRQSRHGHYFTG